MADDSVGVSGGAAAPGARQHPGGQAGDHRWMVISGVAAVAGVLVAVYFGFKSSTPPTVITPAPQCQQGDGNQNTISCNNDTVIHGGPYPPTKALTVITPPASGGEQRRNPAEQVRLWAPVKVDPVRVRRPVTTTAPVRTVTTDPAPVPAPGESPWMPGETVPVKALLEQVLKPVQLDGITGVPDLQPILLAIGDGGRFARVAGPDSADLRLKRGWLAPLNGAALATPEQRWSCARAVFGTQRKPVRQHLLTDLCVRTRAGDVHYLRVKPRPDSPENAYTVRLFEG